MKKKRRQKPPVEIMGRYYDTLSPAEKRQFWKYIYGDSFTVKQAERMEVKYISRTLHFECTLKPADIFPELEKWEDTLDRILDKIFKD